jgi:hypothetical protein
VREALPVAGITSSFVRRNPQGHCAMHIAASVLLVLVAAVAVRGICLNPRTVPVLNVTAYMVRSCTQNSTPKDFAGTLVSNWRR